MINELLMALTLSLSPVDAECLAKNVYFEARNQSDTGGIAVSHVVLNRVQNPKFPDSICKVIKQAKLSQWWLESKGKEVPIRHKCQFSWYCDGLSDDPKEKDAWKHAQYIARQAYLLHVNGFDLTAGSMFYHTKNVNPSWNRAMTKVMVVDDHIFWRNDNIESLVSR